MQNSKKVRNMETTYVFDVVDGEVTFYNEEVEGDPNDK